MSASLLLKNIKYSVQPGIVPEDFRTHKELQNFIDEFYNVMNEGLDDHFYYVRTYMEKYNLTYDDPVLIHYVALNFCFLYTNLATNILYKDYDDSVLAMYLSGYVMGNFAHLNDDLIKRDHGGLFSYFSDNSFCHLQENFESFHPINKNNEIYLRRFLITDPEKKIIIPTEDLKRIDKKQRDQNVDHFNLIFMKIFYDTFNLLTPEMAAADRDALAQFKEIKKKNEMQAAIEE